MKDRPRPVALLRPGVPRAVMALAVPVLMALALLVAGCASRGPSRKEQARLKWNAARAEVMLGLASDQYKHGNFVDARKTTEQGLKLSARVHGLYVLKARLDMEEGELTSASAALDVAKRLAPKDPEPYYLAGVIAERWQQPEEALASYQAALTHGPNELAYVLAVAESLVALERAPEAATMLEERLRYFESSAPLRDMLGQVYSELERHADAGEMFRQASMLAPSETSLKERQALAHVQAGEWRRAAELLERLVAQPELAEKVSLHLALGECRMQQSQHSAARAAYQKAARLDEKNVPAWLGVAKAALADDDLPRVEMALARAEALRPAGEPAADLALLRGYLLLKQDRPEDAAQSFVTAGHIRPRDAVPVAMYGYCLEQMGRPQDAMRFYRRAAELDPDDPLPGELMRQLAATDSGLLP